MHKDIAKIEIEKCMAQGESLVGFFMAQKRPPFWLFFIVGPLAAIGFKVYFVGVTNLGVHFHKLSLLGKFSQHDFFSFNEIKSIKIGNGFFQIPMKYVFANGKTLKLRAQKRGVERVAKADDRIVSYLNEHVKAA